MKKLVLSKERERYVKENISLPPICEKLKSEREKRQITFLNMEGKERVQCIKNEIDNKVKNKSYNKHNYLNSRTKNLSEGELNIRTSKNKLPLISQTEPNINIKVSKKKLEDIINMFKNEPENNSFLQKKYKFKHRGLIPGIPNDIFLRLKYNHDIFNNKKFIEYVKDAPSRKKYE